VEIGSKYPFGKKLSRTVYMKGGTMESILDILWSPEDDWDENDPDWIQIVCVEICCATGINVASDCLNLPATVGTCCDHLPILCG